MKTIKFLCLTLSIFLLVLLQSCQDPCKDVLCNNGACIEGICECDAGYEGESCAIEWRAKILGDYEAVQHWQGDPDPNPPYDAKITADPTNSKNVFFEENGQTYFFLEMTSSTTFLVPRQEFCSGGCIFLKESNGIVQPNGALTFTLYFDDSSNSALDFTLTPR